MTTPRTIVPARIVGRTADPIRGPAGQADKEGGVIDLHHGDCLGVLRATAEAVGASFATVWRWQQAAKEQHP